MFGQTLKTILRYLAKNKVITIINIVGLTFGITFSLLIGLYVKKELSVDKSFINGDNIYRIEFEYPERGKGLFRSRLWDLIYKAVLQAWKRYSGFSSGSR